LFPVFGREGVELIKKFLVINCPKNHKDYYKSPPLKVNFILSPIHTVNTCLSVKNLKGDLSSFTGFQNQAAKMFLLTVFITPLILHSTCKRTYRSYINYYECLSTFWRKCGKKSRKPLVTIADNLIEYEITFFKLILSCRTL